MYIAILRIRCVTSLKQFQSWNGISRFTNRKQTLRSRDVYTPYMENTLVGGLPLSRFLVSVPLSEPVRSTLSIKSAHECRRALRERRQGSSNIGEPRLPLSMIITSLYSTGIITSVYRRAFGWIALKPDRAKLARNRHHCRARTARKPRRERKLLLSSDFLSNCVIN